MLDKRWLLGITGVILIAYVLLSAAAAPAQDALPTGGGETSAVQTALYTACERDGRIAVFSGDTLLLETDTLVSSLPKIDRIRLREGIDLFSEEELKRFLQDYCS